ncbi:MAG: hypothetical protein AAF763_11275 [Pseudomonadota bacterium]
MADWLNNAAMQNAAKAAKAAQAAQETGETTAAPSESTTPDYDAMVELAADRFDKYMDAEKSGHD